MQIVDVVQRVRGEDHRRRAVVGSDRGRGLGPEVVVDDVDALLARHRRQVGRRLDAEGAAASRPREREEEPVVGADVDEQPSLAQVIALQRLGELFEVGVHRRRSRRHVEVVAEEALRDVVGDLDQPAAEAGVGVEREPRLGPVELVRPQERIRRWVLSEGEEQHRARALARPAFRHRAHPRAQPPTGWARAKSSRTSIT